MIGRKKDRRGGMEEGTEGRMETHCPKCAERLSGLAQTRGLLWCLPDSSLLNP